MIHPLGLVAKSGFWHFVAETEAGRRTFRVDRIRSVALSDLPAARPENFDLAEAWREIAATVAELRTRAYAIVHADADALGVLRFQFGADVGSVSQLPEGRFEVEIGGGPSEILAERLAGWGKGIDVIGPLEVRRHLARIGAELVEAYRDV